MNIQEGIDYIKSFYGVPYKWGGSTPRGIDCSGLAIEYLKAVGVTLPSFDLTAQGLHDYFIVTGIATVLGPGSLCFYGKDDKHVSHVTVMINDTLCIGANGGNPTCLTVADADKQNAFVKLRPVNYRSDLVNILRPRYLLA